MIILGSGMAGCIAGMINRDVRILEANSKPTVNHQALLRFRSDEISKATGVPFRKVEIQKSIWLDGKEVQPSVRVTNLYSRKVTGHYLKRSIVNIDPDTRYIAPPDFHNQMLVTLFKNIHFGHKVKFISADNVIIADGTEFSRMATEPIVSTLPIFVNANLLGLKAPDSNYKTNSILITQFKIENCDTFATIYFPGDETPVYRASITGNLMIIESRDRIKVGHAEDVFNAFGMAGVENNSVMTNEVQRGGKIIPMTEDDRKSFLYKMTIEHNFYSLGRFATWRSILLDDVLNDVYVINRIINNNRYDLMRGH